MRRVAMVGAALVMLAATACKPTPEPTVSITAKPIQPACYNHGLEGVAPAGAASVVLQRTVNGKWQDWIWYEGGLPYEQPHRITAPTRGGDYAIQFSDRTPTGQKLSGVIHIRVRSGGGSAVSPGVYVKFPKSPC